MTATLATPAVGPAVTRLNVSAYTIATDAPESDGTIAWDATTIVVVEVRAGELAERPVRAHLPANRRSQRPVLPGPATAGPSRRTLRRRRLAGRDVRR